jgi:glycosyltransferase involved in cell wall biosynthesis
VLTISQASRDDLVRLLGVSPERITVAYPGLQDTFAQPLSGDVEALRTRFGLPTRFVLAVSTIEPRKNYVRLIEAVHALRGRRETADVELVIAGGKGWLYEPVFQRVAALGLEQQVHFVDRPDDQTVLALYQTATVLAHPALYEGFGIPPLEAMARGIPVVCSDTSSLPEVVGDAALMVDPLDVEALAEALGRVLQDDALRAALRARGPIQARQFSWQRTAETALGALHRTAGRQDP